MVLNSFCSLIEQNNSFNEDYPGPTSSPLENRPSDYCLYSEVHYIVRELDNVSDSYMRGIETNNYSSLIKPNQSTEQPSYS